MRDELVSTLHQALSAVLDPRHEGDYAPLLWRYHGRLREPGQVARIVRECRDNFALARFDPRDKVILDAGSGFGVTCLLLRLMGAREVHGVEVVASKVDTFRQITAHLPNINHVHPKLADVRQTGYEPDRFDFVLSNEAISHYHEIGAFLREAWRILKPGGILSISDGNNAANPLCAKETYAVWDRFENGPAGPIPGTEHVVEMPYREQRARVVRETCAELSDQEVAAIVAGTFRYLADQVREAARLYRQTGALPASPYRRDVPPLNPTSGQYIERLIDPADLTRRLRDAGFDARVYT